MLYFWKHSRRLLASLGLAAVLWGGNEYPARPGEQVVPNQLLVRYKPGTIGAAAVASMVPGAITQALPGLQNTYLVKLPPGTAASFSTQLSQHPTVEFVEPNRIRHTGITPPNDPNYALNQYALQNVQASQAWQLLPNVFPTAAAFAMTARIKVAVIDTGADCTHEDFANVGDSRKDAAFGGQISFSLSQAIVATTIVNPTCTWQDDNMHGTHTAGTVAAATNNGLGVAALGYPLELIIYKVLDNAGNGSDSDVATAITAAADAGANVISMSLGGAGYSQTLQDAINHAWQKNCLVVAAAGNSSSSGLFFPAGANYVVGVAATDPSDAKASFSNFGPSVDIAAPGVSILSTLPNNSYGQLSGTSMATPHVAALAGLIEMASPNLSAMVVAQRIQQSADSMIASGGWDQNFGYGRINAWRAISIGNLRPASVGGIVGQVVDTTSPSPQPVPNATVSVNGQSCPLNDDVTKGLFRCPTLIPGMYTMTASATNFPPLTAKVTVVAGADTTMTLVMGANAGEFHGNVTDGGSGVPGAVVQAASGGLIKGSAVTDATGAYSLLVAAGTYDLSASTMYGITATVPSKVMVSNGSVAVDIPMARMGSISGTVINSGNNPVANAQISVTGGGFSFGAITDTTGYFSTIGIPAATYTVVAGATTGFPGATVNGAVVVNDQVTVVNFSATNVTLTTTPPGRSIIVDGTTLTAPQSFVWVSGSTHTLAVSGVQTSGGTRYVFSNWSANTVTGPTTTTYTANFTTQYLLTLAASPSGGGTLVANPGSSSSYYASGASVQVTATANPGYQFANFSGDLTGSTNPQSVTMSAPRSVTANFNVQTTVTTIPAGLSISVDGQTFTAPQAFNWAPGSSHAVAVNSPQNGPPSTQYVWSSWSDGGAISHSITTPGTITTYTANFTTQYLLTLAVSPVGSGTLAGNPVSGSGYYNSGTPVQVTATANTGYQFASFSGDLTGATNPQSVTMSAPRSVTGSFTPTTGITVTTNPPGLAIIVDGQGLTAPQTFNWTQGSIHMVGVSSPLNSAGTKNVWSSWSDGGGISHSITTPATATAYTANFNTQYLLTLAAAPGAGGTVAANPTSSDGYYAGGASVQVTATANPGYQFANLSGDLAGSTNPQSVTMSAPRSVTANFNVQTTVTTSPAGLSITVDGQGFTAPQTFNWAQGSSHTVAVVSPQSGPAGTKNVWSSWSDGGAISHSITTPATSTTYTANFNTQYLLTLAATPGGGGTLAANPTSSDGYYGSGSSVQVTATANPGYQFANFSGDLAGSTNPQSVTMSAPRSLTANFNVQTTVTTSPAGLSITVDGQGFTAPQTFSWAQGSSHTVAVVSPQNGPTGTKNVWSGWSDGGTLSHSITTPGTATTYTANFNTQYLLTLAAAPGGGGTLAANPTSSDGYYGSGSSVQVTATANAGYLFASFSGDLTGSTNPQSVTMSAPRSVTGGFQAMTTVTTNPPGLNIAVDGQTLTAPQTFNWTAGSNHTLAVTSPQNGPVATRYAWSNWSDGGSISHNITAPGLATTYTVNFNTQYALTVGTSPSGGGTLAPNPPSDGYYPSGVSVQVTGAANPGYQFTSFSGDLSGSTNPQSLTMSAPRAVTVNLTPSSAVPNVLTWHNDNARTGQNLQETVLTPANVKAATFGKLFGLAVDGKVDAQPLYVPALTIPGKGVHNVLYVMTEHDSAYAFDADNGALLLQVSLLGVSEVPSDDRGCVQVTPEIGITATPAIDLQIGPHGTMYVVAMSKNGTIYHHRLHALDLTTLTEQFGGPVEIQASYPGTGVENVFDPKQHKERPGLLLANGLVYTSWSSHCDASPYTAWVMSYNESTLAQVKVLNLTPNGNDGAIWAAGSGPAADPSGNVYLLTGNGTFDTTLDGSGFPSKQDYGNAFVKMSTAGGTLAVADYFTMSNTVSESGADTDLGSGGIMLLPLLNDAQGQPRALAVGAGKDKHIYVVDQTNLGKFTPGTNSIYQDLVNVLPGGVWSSPAWFNGNLYYGDVGSPLKAFSFASGKFGIAPSSLSGNSFGYPGTTPSISANGTSNGIVWAAENSGTAVLHAYDATDLSKELYNSNQAANLRDHFGTGNKFIVPTIVNGKVYVGTTNGVGAFGLLPTAAALSITKTHTGSFAQGQQNATYTVTVSNANGAGATSGTVTMTETAPAGLALVSMSGTGWTCGSTTCTRSDVLAGGSSYPAITVTVNVAANATSPQVNQVSVSGGGSATANASDSTTLLASFTGSFDQADCNTIAGWAADRTKLNQSISVDIYDGTTLIATVAANVNRPDVGSFLGDNGNHGFSLATPASLKDGNAHSITVKFAGTATVVSGSPRSLSCSATARYGGSFDLADCNTIAGWAADSNRLNQSINVDLYDGATLIATVAANVNRPDVGSFLGDNGNHGFSLPTPSSLKDGNPHSITVKFAGTAIVVSNSPRSLSCSATAQYGGSLDIADCNNLAGWAADSNRLNQSINVDIYDGATLIATVAANQSRPDVGSFLHDNGNHGFSLPTPASLKDGNTHSITVKFGGTAIVVSNSPRSLSCSAAAQYGGSFDLANCNQIAGWAADSNRLNQSINVDLYDGATLIATVLASQNRPDVGSFLGDNGNHGFNIATPSSLKTGTAHSVGVKFGGTATSLPNSPKSLTCP